MKKNESLLSLFKKVQLSIERIEQITLKHKKGENSENL